MKYIKRFETKNDTFKRDFKIGDIVICVDDSDTNELEMMNKYIIVENENISPFGSNDMIALKKYNSTISIGSWFKKRFIKEKDLENWKIKDNINKYNL
jgi:hypothetical protein